jgi:hypothetical protein
MCERSLSLSPEGDECGAAHGRHPSPNTRAEPLREVREQRDGQAHRRSVKQNRQHPAVSIPWVIAIVVLRRRTYERITSRLTC